MPTLTELFEVHGLVSYDKQLTLSALVEGYPTVSYRDGNLAFGANLSFPIQLIGSQSDYDNTWLWAWANTGLRGWPIEASRQLRAFGLSNHVPELTQPKFELDDLDGHYLSMIGVGLLSADCYYRLPHDEGAGFLVIPSAPEVRALSDLSAHYIASRITDFICRYSCIHRIAVEHYLRSKGYTFSYSGLELTATSAQNQSLQLRFNAAGLLLETSAVVTGPVYPRGA